MCHSKGRVSCCTGCVHLDHQYETYKFTFSRLNVCMTSTENLMSYLFQNVTQSNLVLLIQSPMECQMRQKSENRLANSENWLCLQNPLVNLENRLSCLWNWLSCSQNQLANSIIVFAKSMVMFAKSISEFDYRACKIDYRLSNFKNCVLVGDQRFRHCQRVGVPFPSIIT